MGKVKFVGFAVFIQHQPVMIGDFKHLIIIALMQTLVKGR